MTLQFDDYEINPIHEGDAWKVCDFTITNNNRLKRYFPKTLEQNLNPTLSKIFVDKKTKQFKNKEEFLFTIKYSEKRQLVGLVYLKEIDWEKRQGEFAYAIDYNFNGQNLMTKAIKQLTKYTFNELGLETLQIIAHKDNVSSVNVALNNNFEWQKTLEKGFTPKGEQPLDMELYELYKA
ncbi:GNAT family N-acetyltransferase [Psychroserpens sp.]|uniref:GNAT family N-acetyltransferase n=1 Tax=Psychroserpens sp. TaxID=2020870 RepID=UPI00385B5C3A